jgi:hypothetical protein
MRSIYSGTLTRRALTSVARTNGTANGDTVDTAVFGNNFRTVMFAILTATITDGSHVVSLEDSDNGSAWSAVPADRIQGSLPTIVAANDDTIFEVGCVVTRRYVRVVVTTSTATTGGVFGAVALLGAPSVSPPARS